MSNYLSPEIVKNFEQTDIEYVIPFMEHYCELYFKTGATEQGTVFDIWCENRTGGTSVIEVKSRLKDYATIFLEPDKMVRLIAAYEKYGAWSFFMNYTKENGELLVFFMPIVKKYYKSFEFYQNVQINGPDGPKRGDRFAIPKELAFIFKDGKIIQKPAWTEEHKKARRQKNVDVEMLAKELKKIKWNGNGKTKIDYSIDTKPTAGD